MKDEKVDVTIQWYKANVVRIVFNGRMIWETKEIALDDVTDPDAAFSETTVRLNLLEATNYTQILYRGLQVGRLEQISLLVQLRIEQWQLKIILFEKQLKQRVVDLGLAQLLKAIDPDEPGCGDDDEPFNVGQRCDCGECYDNLECGDECGGGCDDCDGAYCESLSVDDIPTGDDTLRVCKDCAGRNSCAGCEDADPNDRYMNDVDIADINTRRTDAKRADEKPSGNKPSGNKPGGVGLASDEDIYRR